MSRTVQNQRVHGRDDGSSVVVVSPERIGPNARVRDFDQLSERAQRLFVADDATDATAVPDLESGDVVRFTDYYLVR